MLTVEAFLIPTTYWPSPPPISPFKNYYPIGMIENSPVIYVTAGGFDFFRIPFLAEGGEFFYVTPIRQQYHESPGYFRTVTP